MLRSRLTLGFALLGLFAALPAASQPTDNSCIDCHQDATFFAQYPKLHEYYQQWLASPHRQVGVTCDDCHGGDSATPNMEKAHVGVLPMNEKRSSLHYQNQPDTCGQCHRDKKQQFIQSKHFAALMDQRAAPTCTTCHPAMSRRPELRNIVLHACRNCHGEGNSENLPLIADQAERVFTQLNIAGGLLGWTKIHYESHGWPDDSQQSVRDLEDRYRWILNRVHQFDLQQTEDSIVAILEELRKTFNAARNAYEQRAAEDPESL